MSRKTNLLLICLIVYLAARAVPDDPTDPDPVVTIAHPGEAVDSPSAYLLPPRTTSTSPLPYPQPLLTTAPKLTPAYILLPTDTSEPTIPVPTIPPTPEVTPIPLSQPDLADWLPAESGPLWIYYWDVSQIWRMDESGTATELVLDVVQTLGRPLGAIPEQWRGTECCLTGPPVVISPDGRKLALNVGGDSVAENGAFSYTLYIYDLATEQLFDFGVGDSTVWAPDSQLLLFRRHGDLWLAELVSRETQLIISGTDLAGNYISELIWLNGETVALTLSHGMQPLPEIWLMELAQPELRYRLVAETYDINQLGAVPGGDEIFYTSVEGNLYHSFPRNYLNVWKVSVSTGDIQPITTGFRVYGYHYFHDTQIVLFSANQVFVPSYGPPEIDIWLQDLVSGDIFRLTEGLNKGNVLGWYPAGHFSSFMTPWTLPSGRWLTTAPCGLWRVGAGFVISMVMGTSL